MKAKSFLPCFFVVVCDAFKLGAMARMNSRAMVWVSLLLTVAFASRGYPTPLAINIFDTQYTTSVSTGSWIPGGGITNNSRTMISPVPISDSMYHPVSGLPEAEANAGLFGISAFTAAASGIYDPLRANSIASARSDLWFSPLTSETTTITIQFSGWYQWYYSASFVSLLDVTSGHELWNYGSGEEPIPWVVTGGDPRATATLTLDTDFIAGDIYELTMHTWTCSNPPDMERILIQLYGLEPIPEPSTFALVGLASLALAMVQRRR